MRLNLTDLKKCFGFEKTSLERTGRVLVIDGHDVVGYRVVDQLAMIEYPLIRVGVRNTDDFQVKSWEQNEYIIEKVTFEFTDESTWAIALEDVKTVFVTTPMKPSNWDLYFPQFLDACHRAKVKKFIKISFYHSIQSRIENPRQCFGSQDYTEEPGYGIASVPFVKKHALCDGDLILRKKEFDVTIVFSSHLMSNVFRYDSQRQGLVKRHEFYGASRGKYVNYVSPNDVADIAIKAIFDKNHNRQGYNVLGPFPVMDEDVAILLSERLHTAITYVEKPLDFFDKDTAALERIKASGMEENFPRGDFKRVMNRSPQSFREYLRDEYRMAPIERKVVNAFHPMNVNEFKLNNDHVKEEVEQVDDDVEFQAKVEVVEDSMNKNCIAGTAAVAQ